jgi:hypothetical protein
MAAEFCLRNISIHARKVLLHAVNLRHGTDGYGFLSPLKIHRLNPRTLGPVASTLTTSPPRATFQRVSVIKSEWPNLLYHFLTGRRGKLVRVSRASLGWLPNYEASLRPALHQE